MLSKNIEYIKSLAGMQSSFFIKIAGVPAIEVEDFHVEERISYPYYLDITLASTNEMNYGQVVRKEALLTVKGDVMDRYFHGVVRKFEHAGKSNSVKYLYNAQIVPYFSLLSLEKDCRIYQNKNVQDIIADILQEGGIGKNLFDFRLSKKERLRKYCVQFNETDMDFVSRLLQEEGIFYFFEHYKDKHVMIFGDSQANYMPHSCNDQIKFSAVSGMNETGECIDFIGFSKRLSSGNYTHANFNFKMPSVQLEKNEKSKEESVRNYEVYEYPGLYGQIDRGTQLAKSRLDSHQAFAERTNGTSNSTRMIPGYTFNLIDHDFTGFNREYLTISVTHSGQQQQTLEELVEGGTTYFNSFFAIPSKINYSPLRTFLKPLMRGPQTAIVVGRDGDEICTDEYGRVKVQFHWDRRGKRDEKSSCWVRCAQLWGGGGWGAIFTPRVGDEVIVEFLNGDPDYPVVTGSLYNGANPPLYQLPGNMTRSTIKTRSTPNSTGFNELRFEDMAGSEEIFIHGEKDWNIIIKNDKSQNIGHDERLEVKNDKTKTVGNDQKESIGNDKQIMVAQNHKEEIGANMTLSVKGTKTETVEGDESQNVNGTKSTYVRGTMSTTCDSSLLEQVGQSKKTDVGTTYSISANSKIKIICGRSCIEINPSGINIIGSSINLKGITKMN